MKYSLGFSNFLEKVCSLPHSIVFLYFFALRRRGKEEYTEELYKKDLHVPDNHDGVITYLEPDILECEVKWALGTSLQTKLVVVMEFQQSYFKS